MQTLRASWTVTAGIIPGTDMPEYSRVWAYTGEDHADDRENSPMANAKFTEMAGEAHKYSLELNDPARLNWVKLDFVWL